MLSSTAASKHKLEQSGSNMDSDVSSAHQSQSDTGQQMMHCTKRFCVDDQQVLDLTVGTSANTNTTTHHTDICKSSNEAVLPSKSLCSTPSSPSSSSSVPNYCVSSTSDGQDPPSTMLQPPWFAPFGLRAPAFGTVDVGSLLQQHISLFGPNPLNGLQLPPGVPNSLLSMLPLPPQLPSSQVLSTSSNSIANAQNDSSAVALSQGPLNLNIQPRPIFSRSHSSITAADCSAGPLNNSLLSHFSEAMGLCNALSNAKTRNMTELSDAGSGSTPHDLFTFKPSGNRMSATGLSVTMSPANPFNISSTSDSTSGFGPLDFRSTNNGDDTSDELYASRPSSNPICKYGSYDDCGLARCESSGLREHYHCNSCNKVIIRREEMIRHAKWHRKREESLQYGFMRYSPGDNCTVSDCVHNGRQTHYHCLKPNCTKVYISTSDVQMHANFHRKDEVIIQEGFQRFRASEDCGIRNCPFYQEHTTHFHCRRTNCHFTFKNKADMEKHKLHHQKNDNFAKDGFRKFIKCETCGFNNCRYSGIINHIHCVRPGCDYVVHSSSQILSHKRKHDRRSTHTISQLSELTYSDPGQFSGESICDLSSQLENDSTPNTVPDDRTASPSNTQTESHPIPSDKSCVERASSHDHDEEQLPDKWDPVDTMSGGSNDVPAKDLFCDLSRLVTRCIQRRQKMMASTNSGGEGSTKSASVSLENFLFHSEDDLAHDLSDSTNVEHILAVVKHYFHEQPMESADESEPTTAGHCEWPGCRDAGQKDKLSLVTHSNYCSQWIAHVWQAALLRLAFSPCTQLNCDSASHLHCYCWPGCEFLVGRSNVDFSAMYAHVIRHDPRVSSENSDALETPDDTQSACPTTSGLSSTHHSISQFPRRRGRPPKYAKYIRVPRPNVPDELCKDNPHIREIKRSMFLPQLVDDTSPSTSTEPTPIVCGVKIYRSDEACPDNLCDYSLQRREHYHCVRPRCFMASDSLDLMNVHRREFHNHITIVPGFEHFDRSVDCRRPTCHNKRMTQHFHCTHPNCDYAFIRPTTMIQHARKHELSKARSYSDKNSFGLGYKVRPTMNSPSQYHNQHQYSTTHPQPQSAATSGAFDVKPPCLPLGMSPLVAAQLPSFLSNPTNGQPEAGESNRSLQNSEQEQLPGFLPIWAAAMAAAASAMTKVNNMGANPMSNMLMLPNVSTFGDLTQFQGIDLGRSMLDSRLNDEEAPVGV